MIGDGDSIQLRGNRQVQGKRCKSDGSGRYGFVCLGWLLFMAVVEFGWKTPLLGLIAYLAVVWALFAVSRLFFDFKVNTNPKSVGRVPDRSWSGPRDLRLIPPRRR